MKRRIAIKVMRNLGQLDARRDGTLEPDSERLRRAVRKLGRYQANQVYNRALASETDRIVWQGQGRR